MEKFESTRIEQKHIEYILEFIENHHDKICEVSINPVMRDDIFPLLEKQHCVVIYYPIDNEENNGFHVSDNVNNEILHFVYINTAQHKEKQIFTAAHELGHVWDIEKWIQGKIGFADNNYIERIVNRFAAELLMPEEQFRKFFHNKITTVCNPNGLIKITDMIRVITSVMNEFFTSYKSVVYRLYELKLISVNNGVRLWGDDPDCPRKIIEEYSRRISQEQGYSRLYQTHMHYSINGLEELLDIARTQKAMPDQWLSAFYERFKIEPKEQERILETPLPEVLCDEGDMDD